MSSSSWYCSSGSSKQHTAALASLLDDPNSTCAAKYRALKTRSLGSDLLSGVHLDHR